MKLDVSEDHMRVVLNKRNVLALIETMPPDYVANVIGFCGRQAMRIRALVVDDDEIQQVLPMVLMLPAAVGGRLDDVVRRISDRHEESAEEWLESTPLIRALRRRIGA
jgi:hypothetical protein